MILNRIDKLILFYKVNKDEILESIRARNLTIENLKKLDGLIEKLKELNTDYNGICKEKNNCTEKNRGIELRNKSKIINFEISNLEEEIKNILLLIPNTLDKEIVDLLEDKVIFEYIENKEKGDITFEEFTNKNITKSVERCPFLTKEISKIRQLLASFFINNNINNGFTYVETPHLIHKDILFASGHLPRFENNLFKVNDYIYLPPTGEVGLFEYVIKNNLKEARLTTFSKCFRNEDSAPGKVNKCLIRQGQFEKVETFIICNEESKEEEFNILVENVKRLLKVLNFNYRIIKVCPKEMGTSSYLQYDFEVYYPVSNMYIEVASCSNCNKYQTTKANLDKTLITLNCSALPIERILAAYIEYYFNSKEDKFKILNEIK